MLQAQAWEGRPPPEEQVEHLPTGFRSQTKGRSAPGESISQARDPQGPKKEGGDRRPAGPYPEPGAAAAPLPNSPQHLPSAGLRSRARAQRWPQTSVYTGRKRGHVWLRASGCTATGSYPLGKR